MATKLAALCSLLLVTPWLPGCYLAHVAAGQAKVLMARRPIEAVLEDPATPPELRARLEHVEAVRRFAAALGLSVDDRYRHFAPWPGDRLVTTVVATPPGRVEPAGFWFPIAGRVPYKGFFDPERAAAEAERLRDRGLDVCQSPVRAYSTLGWFDDPVTGPMLRMPEAQLVETLFHELVHATVYVPDLADWNEGVASFVGEEARVRFYAAREGAAGAARERARVADQRRVREELLALRDAVARLYAGASGAVPPEEVSRARSALQQQARDRIAALPLSDGDAPRLAASLRLNDACLALVATYAGDTPCYARRLEADGGSLARFVARLRAAAEAEAPRAALLDGVGCPRDSV